MPNGNIEVSVYVEWWLQILLDELAASRLSGVGLVWQLALRPFLGHGLRIRQSEHTMRFNRRKGLKE